MSPVRSVTYLSGRSFILFSSAKIRAGNKTDKNHMTARTETPKGIGPHEGRELELMLAQKKPLAMFSEIVPSSYEWPDQKFEPYVVSGKLVKKEFLVETPDGRHQVRYLFFALPNEAWRIDEAYALSRMHFKSWSKEAEEACVRLGRLLGYTEEDIRIFALWSGQIRIRTA